MGAEPRVVVITGASQGIGAGLVEGFLGRGYRVVANSRSIAPSVSPDVLTIAGDVADPETAGRIVGAAIDRFGGVDTLVNNAGAFLSKPFVDYSEADFATMVGVNLAGFFHVSQRAAAAMLRQHRGHIVTITTSLVDQPMAALPAALAAITKGGLDAVTRSLAIEYAGRGIRVNAVSPGIIKTPMHPVETMTSSRRCIPWAAWAQSRKLSKRCSTSRQQLSSPARRCMSMAAPTPVIGEGR